uniref:Eukaryotic translation initiation factor 3 subunit F n=1 Tax=Calcidiscus leptoporus TaxID=127549 RepID=A0A6U5GMC1_9EUKA|mmetsp:Transcript_30597/g.71148  ORF Transcript_30597/g.71148 Transcript_30597/m.71148 type:complete len:295 (+) Transcript_30597:75-959(+)|eukprot:CAMPEP_0119352230 /NCGR_PEP_ID=MMETSP1334-20130426/1532_1 /TAXON_ID=127549 /ORGANISM="Calcidiscus leptoporus, Strain RCC1130" /LENGTH=294 /DNA_ID=CAMNT_0007365227 /DNA_START=70 /DNA_END=954 /DNA_ORIENTATION=+
MVLIEPASLLHVPGELECLVHPVVLFSIIDHYGRRETGQDRVIGSLLGSVEGSRVEVSSCFPVPHTETEEQVAVNTDFHATMFALHQRVHPKQVLVGWYSTGEEVNDSSLLFHEFYGQDVASPVHLLLDLGLGERRMGAKAYVSKALSLGERRLGTVFHETRFGLVNEEADRIGVNTLIKCSGSTVGASGALGEGDTIELTIKKLMRTLDSLSEYVDKVTTKEVEPEPEVIRALQRAMASAPRLPAAAFDKIFDSQVHDMLSVVYLANLTRAQLALSEKLQAVAIAQGKSQPSD